MKPFNNPIFVTRPLLPNLNDISEKMQQIWDAAWLTNNGKQHQKLESELMRVLKVPYLSLFNNGTIALMVALQSLNLSGEVIVTPFTFPATIHALSLCGIKPVFCDIHNDTMNINVAKIEELITSVTTGILGVHVFGMPCDVIGIQKISDKYGLKVVYDAAHAFCTEIDGTGIGTYGDITMFSFHATKLFHTVEGGALSFNDANLKLRCDLLKNFGIKNEDEVVAIGLNGKMNEVQAAIGLINLNYIESERQKRAKIIETYCENLGKIKGISFCMPGESVKKSFQYFVIRIDKNEFGLSRDKVYEKLKNYNIFARKYFYPLCSNYSCYKELISADKRKLPVANIVASETLSLPLYGALEVDEVLQICDIIKSFKK